MVVRFVMPGQPRVDDAGALGPDPRRTVDLGRCVLRRQRTGHDLVVNGTRPGRALRVLRVSKSGVVTAWRERERLLRALGADLTLVTAVRWEEGGSMVAFSADGDRFVVPVRTCGRHPNLFVYDPVALWRTLGSASWDLIDMHEEPFGLAVAEVLALCRLRSLPHPLRCLLGPEHRQAVSAAVPVVRALVPPQGGGGLHLQRWRRARSCTARASQ